MCKCCKNCIGSITGIVIFTFVLQVWLCPFAWPEIITFRTGKIIQADVLRRTDSFIIIKKDGVEIRYLLSDIESVINEAIGLDESTNFLHFPYFSASDEYFLDSLSDQGSIFGGIVQDSMYRSFERNIEDRPFADHREASDRADDMIKDVSEDFDKHFSNN